MIFKIILILQMLLLTSCASFNNWYAGLIRGKSAKQAQTSANKTNNSKRTTFSENNNYFEGAKKKYGRMTNQKLQDQSGLNSDSGSLWVAEGQESFLFAENTVRLLGDPIPVKIEGDPKDQLEDKMNVIGKLLRKLEEKKKAHLAKIEAEKREQARLKRLAFDQKNGRVPASRVRGVKKRAPSVNTQNSKSQEPPQKLKFKVKTVPSRITERFKDGSYRIEGNQYFLIEGREYKVIVSGIIRSSDFTDAGISAEKLLDSRFDIVTSRRKQPNYL